MENGAFVARAFGDRGRSQQRLGAAIARRVQSAKPLTDGTRRQPCRRIAVDQLGRHLAAGELLVHCPKCVQMIIVLGQAEYAGLAEASLAADHFVQATP